MLSQSPTTPSPHPEQLASNSFLPASSRLVEQASVAPLQRPPPQQVQRLAAERGQIAADSAVSPFSNLDFQVHHPYSPFAFPMFGEQLHAPYLSGLLSAD